MVAAGPIALVGGDEFRPAAEAFDRLLLELVAKASPAVAIVPTAAAGSRPELAASNGVRHFEGLGAGAYAVMIVDRATADDKALLDELRRADVVYFAGGSPPHLVESLRDTAAWACLRELHEGGITIAGSSAGAMAICDRVLLGGEELRGLGLLEGIAVLPHFEGSTTERVERARVGLADGQTLLAIDGATGCVRVDEEWRVEGPGRVQVITRSRIEEYTAGDSFTLG